MTSVEGICDEPRAPLRNLRITWAYHQLAAALAARTGGGANWCSFATWASRQAGQTIRSEDLLETLRARLRLPAGWLHPIHAAWRRLLTAGLYDPRTRLGRVVRVIQGPLDPLERASDAVARGNRKVFAEVGREFARFLAALPSSGSLSGDALDAWLAGLAPGDPPGGQRLLREAFTHYADALASRATAERAALLHLGNLKIGWHEQTRLQPEIAEALDAPTQSVRDLGDGVLDALSPGAGGWVSALRTPLRLALGTLAWPLARAARALAREVVTDCLMTVRLPGDRIAWLGHHLDASPAVSLAAWHSTDLDGLLAGLGCGATCTRPCGADDWGQLDERMHYIAHLFRAFHDDPTMHDPPFTVSQLEDLAQDRLPQGSL